MKLPALAANATTASVDALALQRHLKLEDAAQRFEGMMLQELLKPLQEGKDGSFGGFGGGFSTDDDDRDSSLDTMSSFGTEAVANAIAKAGGLGIAKQVMREVGALDKKKTDDKGGVTSYNGGSKYQNGSVDGKLGKKS